MAEIETDEEKEKREAYEYYQNFVAGPRSLTPMELRMIPILVERHGLSAFTKASFAAANKAQLSSPIRYVEVTLQRWDEEGQRDALENLDEIAREKIEPVSAEKDKAALEKEAAKGNLFAKRILREKGEPCQSQPKS